MPPYDSESSDDGEDYTETNVLLGYASKDSTGDAISHLGGVPSWLDEKTTPSGALSKCKVCNDRLTLLLELNGDLPEHFPGHERRLYVWSCRRRTCRRKEGSVRGLRGVRIAKGASKTPKPSSKPAEPKEKPKDPEPPKNIGGALFGAKQESGSTPSNPFSNPFASNSSAKASPNPFSSSGASANPFATSTPAINVPSADTKEAKDATPEPATEPTTKAPETFASKLRGSSPPAKTQPSPPHEPWPAASEFPSPFPHYHLDAEYETLDAPSTPQVPSSARLDVDGEGSGGGKDDKEIFESTMDKTFQKFADRVGQNPEQVLRYEFRGKPLLYSDTDAIGKALSPHAENGSSSNSKVTMAASRSGSVIPRCTNCGADRVFEVQLTPHAITELEADEAGIEGMEWGTILLGVCSKDCKPNGVGEGDVGYVEEWVGVQWEELTPPSKR